MKYTLITILIFSLALGGCKNQTDDTHLISVDITSRPNDLQINLNEYVDDLKIVRLESNDSSLISSFSGHVGEKYIISIERDRVLLFNSEGEFSHAIAKRGKGPGEYTQIDAWAVDENENFFLYHDIRKNYICNYNLNNQRLEENIPFEDHGSLSRMVLINDTVLSILPGMFAEYGYLFFNQTLTGQIKGGITKENVPHPGAWAGRSAIFKRTYDNSIIFQPSESDTVFRIDGTEMLPVYYLLVDKPQKNGNVTTGSFASYLHSDKNILLIVKSGFESTITPNSSSISTTGSEYISVDLETMKRSKIDQFSLEIMDMELDVSNISFPKLNQVVITYQAVDFKKNIDAAIKSADANGLKKERLMQLNSEISENDNPILITGKWK